MTASSATFRDRVEYLLFRAVVALLASLPLGAALAVGRALGDLAYGGLRIRRRVALENLALVEPDPRRRRRLARSVYRNLGETLVEFARLPSMRSADFAERLTMEGEEHLAAARRSGRGAVLLSGHFGSWEIFGAGLAARGHPVSYVVGAQRNPLVGAFIEGWRHRLGLAMFPVGASVRGAWRELKENRFVCLLADQDAGRDGLFVPLLGRDASTATGPASLALRSGAAMIPGFILRRGGGRHHMVLEPPIPLEAGLSPDEAVARATRRYVEILESYLRRYPDHWFWVHRRWKTRPAGRE